MTSPDCDWPPRQYGWRIERLDGAVVDELGEAPPMEEWDDLDLERVEVLHVVDAEAPEGGDEVVTLDATTGVFEARGAEVRFGVNGEPFDEMPVHDLVQWKRGYSEYRNGVGQRSGLVSITIGYRREAPALVVEPTVSLRAEDGSLGLEVRLSGAGVEEGDIDVFVDGDLVESEEAFRERVGPSEEAPVERA